MTTDAPTRSPCSVAFSYKAQWVDSLIHDEKQRDTVCQPVNLLVLFPHGSPETTKSKTRCTPNTKRQPKSSSTDGRQERGPWLLSDFPTNKNGVRMEQNKREREKTHAQKNTKHARICYSMQTQFLEIVKTVSPSAA